MSRNKLKTFFSSLFAIGALALTSCDFGFNENSFQNKAAAYFKEMTSTAAISVYQIAPDDYVNNSAGVPCLPCTGDHTVTFILRNPQKYTFDKGSNMDLGLGDFAEYWGVEIVQDPSDTSKITVTYSEQFLREYGMGTDVSPKVTLYHPVSHSNFGLYDKLAISSDNPPPTPSGAVCMQSDENPSRWVLCFDLPKTPLIKALHQDISSIDINGHTFGVSVDSNGNISYAGGSELSTARPSGLYANQNTGQSFTSAGQAAYFVTGDKADETEKVYQITVTDKAGLSSSLNVSARGFKLGAPKAYQTDDSSYANPFTTVLATKNAVGQEEDGSAHITIHAEAMTASVSFTDKSGAEKTITPEPYDPSDAYILYEVYTEYDSDSGEFSNLVGSGKIKGLTGKVTIPGGTSYVRAYVQKPLYSDSDAIVWNCRAVCTNYFVSAVGGDDNAAGSKAAPLATIAKAVQKFENGINVEHDYEGTSGAILTVQVMSDISQTGGVTWSHGEADAPILKINGYGGKRKVDYANSGNAVHITDGRVYANNITFANCSDRAIVVEGDGLKALGFECDNCAFEDCHTADMGGAIFNQDGVVVVSNSSFLRCHTDSDSGEGGAIYILGDASAKITGCTFKGCSASRGAAIYSERALLIYSSTISGNTTAAADSGAVHYAGDPGQFTIGGANNYILENPNTEAGKDRNVYLPLNHYICVDGLLTGSQIGVYMPFTSEVKPTSGTPKPFTLQYSFQNSETKPGVYFKTDTSYNIAEASGEAAFAVGGGAMVDALNYNVTFAGDAVPSAIYPGMPQVFKIKPTYKQKSPAKDLFLNPADKKLYGAYVSGAGYTGLVGGGKSVEFKAELYCGSTYLRDLDLEVAGHGDDQRICVTVSGITLDDHYSVKVIANYLGVKYTSSYAFGCNKKAETVAAVIASLSNPATVTEYTFVVEGGVGSGYTMSDDIPVASTTEDNGLMLVANAIRTHGDGTVPLDNVRINLDARATSAASDIESYALGKYFKNCKALTAIQLPDWMEYVVEDLFNGCSNLASVTFSPNTQWIGKNAFNGCSALASVTLPQGVTGASIPHHLHGIEAGAFVNCASGFAITYQGTKEQWGQVKRSNQNVAATKWHDGAKDTSDSSGKVTCSGPSACGLDYKYFEGTPDITALDDPSDFDICSTVNVSNVAGFKRIAEWADSETDFHNVTIALQGDVTVPDDYVIKQFRGTFDGNNHTVTQNYTKVETSGTTMTIQGKTLYPSKKALFWSISNDAVIKNLNVTGNVTRAGLVGDMFAGAIEDCVVNVAFSGEIGSDFGGVVAEISGPATVKNCVFKGSVKTDKFTNGGQAGGIVGGVATNSVVVIENCINKGAICTTGQQVAFCGGIVGYSDYPIIIRNCKNTGDVRAKFAGGIIGHAERVKVINCNNLGNITKMDNGKSGGIVGDINPSSYDVVWPTLINNCSYGSADGGIIGFIDGSDASQPDNTYISGNYYGTASKAVGQVNSSYSWSGTSWGNLYFKEADPHNSLGPLDGWATTNSNDSVTYARWSSNLYNTHLDLGELDDK